MDSNSTHHVLRALARGAVGLAAVAGAAAFAQPAGQIDVNAGRTRQITQTKAVYTADLNLAEMRGQERLRYRIRTAAKEVCETGALWSSEWQSDYRRCFRDAVDGAQAEAMRRFAAGDRSPLHVSG